MKITRRSATATQTPPAEYFTGTVYLDPIVQAPEPARVSAALVTFTPGARTNWHTHPYGQTLYITAGTGRVRKDGEAIQTVGAGDVVFFEPGERHWHGAGPDTMMSHIAIQEAKDGRPVEWLEPVSDEDYGAT